LLGLDSAADLVFSEIDGSVWDPDAFLGLFTRAILKSGLPRISLHELRHSYASISQWLGTPLYHHVAIAGAFDDSPNRGRIVVPFSMILSRRRSD
jgi:hypothetical protein